MPDTTHAVRIALDGKVTDLDIGTNLSEQAKSVSRALLDSVGAIEYIDRPDGSAIVVLAGQHRARQLPNFYGLLVVHTLSGAIRHEIHGPVVLAGYTRSGEIVALPEDAATLIRELCPDNPDGIPAIVHVC